jgi:hypothetical protein
VIDEEEWVRALRTRDALAAQFLGRPEVTMIDIGTDETEGRLVLRIHVRGRADTLAGFPDQFEGIPVQLVYGEYRPEKAEPG